MTAAVKWTAVTRVSAREVDFVLSRLVLRFYLTGRRTFILDTYPKT
jgi:hypothetical protein